MNSPMATPLRIVGIVLEAPAFRCAAACAEIPYGA